MKLDGLVPLRIMEVAEDGDSIRDISGKAGFAYSAVYKWVHELAALGAFELESKGNKTVIHVDNGFKAKFSGFMEAVRAGYRNREFWEFIKNARIKARFVEGSAIAIWTKGGYLTGDFFDRVYNIEVLGRDYNSFESGLARIGIKPNDLSARPAVLVKVAKGFSVERVGGLPVIPLGDLVKWCQSLHLEPVLEQLDSMYHLGLGARYSEVSHG